MKPLEPSAQRDVGPFTGISVPTKLVSVPTSLSKDDQADVESVKFSAEGLAVTVAGPMVRGQVLFLQTYGFRVLDELDMTDFWSDVTLADGCLFEVTSGGWKDLECSREAFKSGRFSWVREFVVVGRDHCVSVLTKEEPVMRVDIPAGSQSEDLVLRGLTHRIGEVLHYLWDPIGVSGMAEARDEYDMYVPQVLGLLTSKATSQEIAAFLTRVAVERMGLNPNPEAAERAALAACEWFAHLPPPGFETNLNAIPRASNP